MRFEFRVALGCMLKAKRRKHVNRLVEQACDRNPTLPQFEYVCVCVCTIIDWLDNSLIQFDKQSAISSSSFCPSFGLGVCCA